MAGIDVADLGELLDAANGEPHHVTLTVLADNIASDIVKFCAEIGRLRGILTALVGSPLIDEVDDEPENENEADDPPGVVPRLFRLESYLAEAITSLSDTISCLDTLV